MYWFLHQRRFRLLPVLVLPVALAACLHLDIGTVLSLRKMDPYTVDLVASRAAVLVPEGVGYANTVNVGVRMMQGKSVLDKEKFDLETLADGEELSGIDLAGLPRRPIIIRLAKADARRANALQKRLGARDKNHQWIEPADDTISDEDKDAEHPSEDKDKNKHEALTKGKVQGELSMGWRFSLNQAGYQRFCVRGKTIRLWVWVKLNDSPNYRRVIHGLPLKRLYGKEGMKTLCAQKPVETDGPIEPPVSSPSEIAP